MVCRIYKDHQGAPKMTHKHFDEILEMLNSDMVSRGLITQCLEESKNGLTLTSSQEGEVLSQLLASDGISIGVPKQLRPDYIEFVGWMGTVEDRVRRAMDAVDNAVGHDKEFAYWLCLRKNVDRFEGK